MLFSYHRSSILAGLPFLVSAAMADIKPSAFSLRNSSNASTTKVWGILHYSMSPLLHCQYHAHNQYHPLKYHNDATSKLSKQTIPSIEC